MKKILAGLAAGIAIGYGISRYIQKPQPVKQIQTVVERCERTQPTYTSAIASSIPQQKIDITEDSMVRYGEQLYKEMYNGECIDINKFLESKEQIISIYREYGFEKAKLLYESLDYKLSKSDGHACGFKLNSYDLKIAYLSAFPLEDLMKLLDPYELRRELDEYLRLQNKKTREEYIDRLCENQENAFLDPIEADDSICRGIANHFTKEVLNSTSIAQEVPEIGLISKFFDETIALQESIPFESDESYAAWLSLVREFISKVANIVCERYNSDSNSESGANGFIALEEFTNLAERNLEMIADYRKDYLHQTVLYEYDIKDEVKKQCGKKEE